MYAADGDSVAAVVDGLGVGERGCAAVDGDALGRELRQSCNRRNDGVVGGVCGLGGVGLGVEGDDNLVGLAEGHCGQAQLGLVHVACGEVAHLCGSHEVGSDAEVVVVCRTHDLTGNGRRADGLYVAHGAVLLIGHVGEILPCELEGVAVFDLVEDAGAYAPSVAVGEECRAAGLIAIGLVGVEQRALPVAGRLLAGLQCCCHAAVVADVLVAVAVCGGQLLQHTREGCEYPSVAARPEILLAGQGLVGRIDVVGVAVVEILVGVIHAVGVPSPVGVHLVEIELVASDVVELGHDGHHHEEAIDPPEVALVAGAHLILHDLACACYLCGIVGGVEVVEVGIDLEAHLVVAEEHVVGRLAVGVFPLALVGARGALPVVAHGPCGGEVEVLLVVRDGVGLHVADVINGSVPEVVAVRGVALLPCLVDAVEDVHDVVLERQCLEAGGREWRIGRLLELLECAEPVGIARVAVGGEDAPSSAEVEGELRAGCVVEDEA